MKLTLGTGSFLSVNTGAEAYPTISGSAYPAIGWKLRSNNKPTYILESDSSDTGTSILWAQQLDFFTEPAQTINLANSVADSGGVYFVPSRTGTGIYYYLYKNKRIYQPIYINPFLYFIILKHRYSSSS